MLRLLVLLLVTFLSALWPLSASTIEARVHQQSSCLFFTETGGGRGGYPVCDDADARFRSAFDRWGLQRIGYPISQRYVRDGFLTQAFQKAIMQWRPESGTVSLVNIFDDLHVDGYDRQLVERRQTPYPLPADWDGNRSWAETVRARQALLDARPALQRAYFASDDPLTFFGLPTSAVQDMGNHFAVRLQRAVLQEWKEPVPWARAGEVTIANGGDIAKELGGLPVAALAPSAGSPVASQPPSRSAPSAPAAPARVRIPRIQVDAAVESVGQTATGNMDVPQLVQNVAWYRLGARPGETGNAVLSGHLDDYKGDPAVFWRLNELRVGDEISVIDEAGQEWLFQVVKVASYPFDRAPLVEIFGPSQTSNLNLITCEGSWNASVRNYDQRLVVYTQLVRAGR